MSKDYNDNSIPLQFAGQVKKDFVSFFNIILCKGYFATCRSNRRTIKRFSRPVAGLQ
jgi:hypothetical protein